jgi:hypothetical protein
MFTLELISRYVSVMLDINEIIGSQFMIFMTYEIDSLLYYNMI